MIPGISKFEKRSPNPSGRLPQWEPNKCTQCKQCVFVCPHAAIRSEFVGKKYTLQVSVLDCTGCNACVEVCPEAPYELYALVLIVDWRIFRSPSSWRVP